MAILRKYLADPIVAYIAAPFLIGATTYVLFVLQAALIRHEGEYINAYVIGLLLPIGLLAALGGRGPGLFALMLSSFLSVYVLMHPHFSFGVKYLSDWMALALQIVAGVLLIAAIDTAQRNQQLRLAAQAYAEREGLINEIGRALRISLDPDKLLETALRMLGEALAVDRCVFITCGGQDNICVIESEWRRPDFASLRDRLPAIKYDEFLNEGFQEAKTQIIDDSRSPQVPPGGAEGWAAQVGRASIFVPLFDGSNLLAVLVAAMEFGPRFWLNNEIALTESVATQAQLAREAALSLRREQHIASILQDALQPKIPTEVVGLDMDFYYKSALDESNVGGDFYDVFPLADKISAIIVGDVSGKGLAAAAQIATIRNMLRFALYEGGNLDHAIAHLNSALTVHGLLPGFVTVIVSLYDAQTNRLAYVSCGHEPGLLLRAATGEIEELPSTGPVLGILSDAGYHQHSRILSRGDVLLYYTDGVSEAGPNRNAQLGVEGLEKLLGRKVKGETAHSLTARIARETITHAEGMLHDDLCMLTAIVR